MVENTISSVDPSQAKYQNNIQIQEKHFGWFF